MLEMTSLAGSLPLPSQPEAPSALQQPRALKQASDNSELRKTFDQFVGETFYGQMMASMRKTVGKAAYFHGGRAEEVFQGQMEQILTEKLSQADGGSFGDAMFELFNLSRK